MKLYWKSIFLAIIVSTFLGIPPALAQMEKVGYVNVTKILEGYQRAKDDETTLTNEGQAKQKQRDGMVEAIRKLKDEQNLLSDDAKAKKQDEIDQKVRELQDFDMATRQQLTEKRRNMLRDIFNDIDVVVKSYAERKGLDFVFSENVLLYHNPKFDGTTEVLDELNRNFTTKKR
jgi:Skp family chaperone for outer membrane proteins